MNLAVKFFQKTFTLDVDNHETGKQLYARVNKWVADYIIKKVEVGETFWRVSKVSDSDLPAFKLELYALLDSEEASKNFCNRCKEFHSSFYLNQQFNCDACNYTAFKKQMKEKLQIKKEWRKSRLKLALED